MAWGEKRVGVVIVAGGSGSRMGAAVPKQFLKVGGEYILVRTIRALEPYAQEIVVVLPEGEMARWREIALERGLDGECCKVCAGGASRFESVRNGLARLGECDLVAIHDGVRPLLSARMIERGLECAATYGAAIPVVDAVDSFRMEREGELKVVDRSRLKAVQTPQIFAAEVLKEAYSAEPNPLFTDDATVVELSGVGLAYYEGERRNIKITTPEDLIVAEALARV
jgi:2-C-methyl-D-erythritol 4-phosphate cytidylyltransferase